MKFQNWFLNGYFAISPEPLDQIEPIMESKF